MKSATKIGVSAVLLVGSYVALDHNGYGYESFIESFQDRTEIPAIPPHKQGSIEEVGRDRISSVAQFVVAGASKDRVIDRAYGFRSTVSIKDLFMPDVVVYESYADDQVMYLTKSVDGKDVGFDIAGISIELQAPEADLSDGLDDNKCITPENDVENRGCELNSFVDSGFLQGIPGLGADNNGNLGYKINLTDYLFNENNRCLLDFYILPIVNSVLEKYGEELKGPNKYTELMKIWNRGALRLQQFEAGVPPQRIEVNVVGEYVPDPTLQDVFDTVAASNPQNIDAPVVAEDWCAADLNGDKTFEDLGDLELITELGRVIVAPFYNPAIRAVDLGNNMFAPVDKQLFEDLKRGYGS